MTLTCIYDAWNRLVKVQSATDSSTIAEYSYNGLNQRIKKSVGNNVTFSYFNEKWQELESRKGNELMTYVWGLRYIDDLIYREKDSERLYSLADPNWNVIAIADTDGIVQERMKYDAFGKIAWSDEEFVTKTTSSYKWNRAFTGQVFDTETGLMLYRNRFYHSLLGRFVSRDPIGYDSTENNFFSYVNNQTTKFVDSYGLQKNDFFGRPLSLYDRHIPKPPATACCEGVQYAPRTECCENGQVVQKQKVGVVNRGGPLLGFKVGSANSNVNGFLQSQGHIDLLIPGVGMIGFFGTGAKGNGYFNNSFDDWNNNNSGRPSYANGETTSVICEFLFCPSNVEQMVERYKKLASNPPKFNLATNNCSKIAGEILGSGGFPILHATIETPNELIDRMRAEGADCFFGTSVVNKNSSVDVTRKPNMPPIKPYTKY